jgi:3-phosphoshikimate 1-carboxyvinyltransferase
VAHLVHKESNRLAKPAGELKKLGARISFTRNELVIRHSRLHGGEVSSCGDHRIAMALAVAGLRIPGGVVVHGAECISKSYPRFVADMIALGAPIERERIQRVNGEL